MFGSEPDLKMRVRNLGCYLLEKLRAQKLPIFNVFSQLHDLMSRLNVNFNNESLHKET